MGDLKFQLQHYAAELWRRKWSVLLVSMLVGLLGCYMAATRPDVFTSRAAVEVDDSSLLDVFLPKGVPRQNTQAAIDSVRRAIYARPNLEEIIRQTGLHLTLNDQRGWEAMVANLEETLELKRQGPNFYVIEYTHNDPVVARNVTQAALDLFLEKGLTGVSGTKGPEYEATQRLLKSQYATSSDKLAKVEAELATYERQYGDELSGSASIGNEMRGLEAKLATAQSDRLLFQQQLANIQSRISGTQSEIIVRYEPQPGAAPTVPPSIQKVPVPSLPSAERQRANGFEDQVAQLQLELQNMLERLTPQHPDVSTLQRRMQQAEADLARLRGVADAADAQLQQRIQQAVSQNAEADRAYEAWRLQQGVRPPDKPIYGPNPVLADLRAQADGHRSRITVLDRQISVARQEIANLRKTSARQPEILQAYNKLKSDEGKYSGEVEALEQKLSLLQMSSNPDTVSRVDFRVVEPPQVPVTPAGPNRLLLFMAAFLLAGGSGIGLAFLRLQLADNMPTLTHLKQSFDMPILGGVSMIESKSQVARNAAGNLVFLASVAALITIFGYVTYRYHFELWRPDIASLASTTSGSLSARN